MKKISLLMFVLVSSVSSLFADTLDSLQKVLTENPQVQEKIYIHTDNTCYFQGDTLWYKAYVLRSDNLMYTDMSKILYVELLNPDGLVVQRQQVVVSNKGYTNGNFVVSDNLYSGYYELRAYTRWNLNFNEKSREYSIDDKRKFYNYAMAKDFFRQWEGLYSRVIPIYEKPKEKGDYASKYIVNRPKEDLMPVLAPKLNVSFYPEGGSLVAGIKNTVAFEVTDQDGKNVDLSGKLSDGTVVKTTYKGRGTFQVIPNQQTASFIWNGKEYKFQLPKASSDGVALHLSGNKLSLSGKNAAAFAVLCRGKLYDFQRVQVKDFILDTKKYPTGINEVIVFDASARPMASRLFFVNHNDMSVPLTVATTKTDYQPFDSIGLEVKAEISQPTTISLAVRDGSTDDASYDDGNMLTEILLSSELKGFIANPAYYFEKSDAQHEAALDLLMMVQGWRRYDRVKKLRYSPEKTFSFEGKVCKLLDVALTEQDDVYDASSHKSSTEEEIAETMNLTTQGGVSMTGEESTSESDDDDTESGETDDVTIDPTEIGVNNKGINKQVLVEAEIVKGNDVAGMVERTDNKGNFSFQIPPFYDKAVLFVKAYNVKDSLKKNMASTHDPDWKNERAYPDFYVKRNVFFPIFSYPYSWYQTHQPEYVLPAEQDIDGGAPQGSKLAGEHQLQTVKVVAGVRSRRGIQYSKPAMSLNVYDLYNDVTDYGLSFGVFQMNSFPEQAAMYLYGNFGRRNKVNIRAMIDGTSIYRNYTQTNQEYDKNQAPTALFSKMMMKRLDIVNVYSDYEPRVNSGLVEHSNGPAVTFDFKTYEDEGASPTYRDRRYILSGFAFPDKFYSPDYSKKKPEKTSDYRRTLYWNPNIVIDDASGVKLKCFNNGKETRIKISAAGMTQDGKVLLYK